MSLIKCRECANDVSSEATVCPKCGYPVDKLVQSRYSINQATPAKSRGIGFYIAAIITVVIVVPIVIGSSHTETPQELQARKDECTKAMMSSIGTNTTNYADKQAYNQYVKDHCQGLQMNGVSLDK